jgi:ABC-2 type transport system ATP-binding protein
MPSHAGRQTALGRRVPELDGRLPADPAIDVAGLTKSFGPVQVLCGVDFQVRRGSVFALLGPNGAGKTTIVRILSTLASVDAGRVRVAGFDVATEVHQVRRNISLTAQFAAIDELHTGEETLRMMGRLWGLGGGEARRRSAELLEQFDLAEAGRRQVRYYSGGMRRRLDLAASLVSHPAVIFLDEPTTGLDVRSRQTMWEAVRRLAADGSTVFLTTQYLEEADQLAGHVAILDGGRIVAAGAPAELKAHVGAERLELVLADEAAFDAVAQRLGRRVLAADRAQLAIEAETDGTGRQARALLDESDPDRRAVRHFALRSPTLDDVFLALTGHAARRPDQETVDA